MNKNVILLEHPMLQHKLSLMRQKETNSQEFRELLYEISTLLAFEATRESSLKIAEWAVASIGSTRITFFCSIF